MMGEAPGLPSWPSRSHPPSGSQPGWGEGGSGGGCSGKVTVVQSQSLVPLLHRMGGLSQAPQLLAVSLASAPRVVQMWRELKLRRILQDFWGPRCLV